MDSKKRSTIKTVVIAVAIVLVLVFGLLYRDLLEENRQLKKATSGITEGRGIPYFELVGLDEKFVGKEMLNSKKPTCIFFHPANCALCSPNMVFWRLIHKSEKDRYKAIGVVLSGDSDAFELNDNKKIDYDIFVPDKPAQFKQSLNITDNLARTVVVHEGVVKKIFLGPLSGEQYTEVMRLLVRLSKSQPST